VTEPTLPGAPTAADLIAYVGGSADADAAWAARKLAQAERLVSRYVLDCAPAGTTDLTAVVPAEVLHEAFLEVGKALWSRRDATAGAVQYETLDAAPSAVLGDPLTAVYPDLDRFLAGGFA